jgi:uncharacterized Zn-finger protein
MSSTSIKDKVIVKTHTVSCEGNSSILGHPKIYLTFKVDEKQVVCPYCSKIFILDSQTKSSH